MEQQFTCIQQVPISWEMSGASTAWCSAGGALLYPTSLSQKLQGLQEGYTAVRLLHAAGAGAEGADSWKLTAPTAGHRAFLEEDSRLNVINPALYKSQFWYHRVVFQNASH